jgi:hypothetical protein
MYHGWISQFGPIAIAWTNRIGKPTQLSAATCRTSQPVAVVPPDGLPGKGSVVLLCT